MFLITYLTKTLFFFILVISHFIDSRSLKKVRLESVKKRFLCAFFNKKNIIIMYELSEIHGKIHEVRGISMMLDFDLAVI